MADFTTEEIAQAQKLLDILTLAVEYSMKFSDMTMVCAVTKAVQVLNYSKDFEELIK